MGMLCAVSFNRYGRLFYLDPAGFEVKVGDRVLVPTEDGPEVAGCRTDVESSLESEHEREPTNITADPLPTPTEDAPAPIVTADRVTHFDGIGWRIRDGVYEDAIAV